MIINRTEKQGINLQAAAYNGAHTVVLFYKQPFLEIITQFGPNMNVVCCTNRNRSPPDLHIVITLPVCLLHTVQLLDKPRVSSWLV